MYRNQPVFMCVAYKKIVKIVFNLMWIFQIFLLQIGFTNFYY